jgi:hypothetical protein
MPPYGILLADSTIVGEAKQPTGKIASKKILGRRSIVFMPLQLYICCYYYYYYYYYCYITFLYALGQAARQGRI